MKRWNTMVLGAGLALAAATGAWAQGAAKVEGDLAKPMKVRQKAGQATGKSAIAITQSDGDQTVEVRIEDDQVVSAKINGKEVPKDRIRHGQGKVEILGRDGEVIRSFSVGGAGAGEGTWWYGGAPGAWRGFQLAPGQGGGFELAPGQGGNAPFLFTPGEAVAPPKVMLGINMGQPDEETAEKAGVSADEAIHITRVIEGLPAAEAGLKEGDIVTKIAGKSPATPDALRKILREKKPGDTIRVTVVREGDEKTLTIELAEYDGSALGVQALKVEPGQGMQGLGEFRAFDQDEMKALEEAHKAWNEALQNLPRQPQFRRAPDQPGMIFRAVPEGGSGNGRLQERLADLDGRMAEIDRRLGELNERLERLTQKLEKLGQNDRP